VPHAPVGVPVIFAGVGSLFSMVTERVAVTALHPPDAAIV
jgi:hypothetical protein